MLRLRQTSAWWSCNVMLTALCSTRATSRCVCVLPPTLSHVAHPHTQKHEPVHDALPGHAHGRDRHHRRGRRELPPARQGRVRSVADGQVSMSASACMQVHAGGEGPACSEETDGVVSLPRPWLWEMPLLSWNRCAQRDRDLCSGSDMDMRRVALQDACVDPSILRELTGRY